jgi:hypothetical protein
MRSLPSRLGIPDRTLAGMELLEGFSAMCGFWCTPKLCNLCRFSGKSRFAGSRGSAQTDGLSAAARRLTRGHRPRTGGGAGADGRSRAGGRGTRVAQGHRSRPHNRTASSAVRAASPQVRVTCSARAQGRSKKPISSHSFPQGIFEKPLFCSELLGGLSGWRVRPATLPTPSASEGREFVIAWNRLVEGERAIVNVERTIQRPPDRNSGTRPRRRRSLRHNCASLGEGGQTRRESGRAVRQGHGQVGQGLGAP